MPKILLIGGTNHGTRVITNDPTSPIEVAARNQAAVSCEGAGHGAKISSIFETYYPVPVQINGIVKFLHMTEDTSVKKAWDAIMEGV